MRISKNNTIKANATDKDGKLICIIYDSGFENLGQILNEARRRAQYKKVCFVSVHDVDADRYTHYKVIGDRMVKDI